MEKTLFFFTRKASRDKADFDSHYIGNHAPLGKKLTFCLKGYTVNLVDSDGGPDAITEHWVDHAMDLLTREKSYATLEDAQQVWDDDSTLFDGFELYVIDHERVTVDGAEQEAPLEQATPGVKIISTHPDFDAAPPPPASARRVVDCRIKEKLLHQNGGWVSATPEFRLVRMAWADTAQGADENAIVTREHRFIRAAPLA